MWGKDSNPYSLLRGMQPAAVTMESVWRSPQKSRKRFTIDPVVPPLDVISKYFFLCPSTETLVHFPLLCSQWL